MGLYDRSTHMKVSCDERRGEAPGTGESLEEKGDGERGRERVQKEKRNGARETKRNIIGRSEFLDVMAYTSL